MKVATLTSDFGLKDPYAAEMKAVILEISPSVVLVDITHCVEKFNIRTGAFVLASAAPYFPVDTVHVAVVDPGVGSQRRGIIVQTQRSFFVGPDNGLLMLAAVAEGIERVHEITSRHLMLPHVSPTFHGRDVFAPVAAHLLNGVAPHEFGPQITDPMEPTFAKVEKSKGKAIGEVLHIDDFGNAITNIHSRDFKEFGQDMVQIKVPRHAFKTNMVSTYANIKNQAPALLVGSHGYLEIALNQSNVAVKLGLKVGDKVELTNV